MPNIDAIVRQINREFVPHFEEKLRSYLADQEREWLVEQIVRLTLDAHSLEEMDRKHLRDEEGKRRAERAIRVAGLQLNREKLVEFLGLFRGLDRERLLREGLLQTSSPSKGGPLILAGNRSPEGEALLGHAKDVL